jgi:hypothetical protein
VNSLDLGHDHHVLDGVHTDGHLLDVAGQDHGPLHLPELPPPG